MFSDPATTWQEASEDEAKCKAKIYTDYSNCCGAESDRDQGRCSDCKEGCGFIMQDQHGNNYCVDCKSLLGKDDLVDEGHKCN